MKFENHIVVVTGAASGMGYEIARQFIDNGAAVYGLDKAPLDNAVEQLGDRFLPRRIDISAEHEISSLAQEVKRLHGKLDILINNAGVFRPSSIIDFTVDSYDFQYGVLFKGPVFMVKHFAALLQKAERPCVINTSSIGARIIVHSHSFVYGSAKAAIEKFTKFVVTELPGVRCNAILPGVIDTPMVRRSEFSPDEQEAAVNFAIAKIPVGRLGLPRDVANLVLFLCSEMGEFINGESITVDGGQHCGALLDSTANEDAYFADTE